jgi:arylsulfatase A-like enzyme
MICFTDCMATFAEMVGDKFPEAATTDSRSFLPILKGDLGYQVRDTMILNAKRSAVAFRHRNWKLITTKGPGGFTHWDGKPSDEPAGQLYDLAKDPSEQNNLWREMPSKVKAMRALLAKEKSNKKNDKTLK